VRPDQEKVAEPTQSEPTPVEASFAAHIEAFHQSLPREEQELLEQLFALAQSAGGEASDVQGFAFVTSFQWGVGRGISSPTGGTGWSASSGGDRPTET